MGSNVSVTKALTAASDTVVAASQTPGAAGNLSLVGGGTVTLDTPRQVILTFAADETGHSFVLYGNDAVNGNPISETIAGTTAGIVTSTRMYGQVTRVSISAAATGAIKVGTNGVGATQWYLSDLYLVPPLWTIAVVVTGTVNYSVQYTYDSFNAGVGQSQTTVPTAFTDPILNAATATGETTFNFPITGWRVLINSGTGSLAIRGIQPGVRV